MIKRGGGDVAGRAFLLFCYLIPERLAALLESPFEITVGQAIENPEKHPEADPNDDPLRHRKIIQECLEGFHHFPR